MSASGARRAVGVALLLPLLFLPALLPAPPMARSIAPPGAGPAAGVLAPAPSALGKTASPGPVRLAGPSAGGQGRLIVNSSDPAIVPNSGLRTNITDYLAYPFSVDSAFQVGAEETIGDYVAVFGIFQNDQTFPVPFFSVFSNVTDATVHLAYWNNLTLVGGTSYDFELALDRGTNWTLTVNGQLFGGSVSAATFDFARTEATWRPGVSFSEVAIYAGAPTTPSVLSVPLSFAVLRSGGWYLPQTAEAYMVASANGWGAEGRLQNGTIAPGEIVTGQSIPLLPNGTALWAGGPVPVSLGLGLASTTIRGTMSLLATLSVVGAGGRPLPGVPVYLSDNAGAIFSPRTVVTDGTGFARAVVGAPNVSVPTLDLVVATVILFGYYGEVGVALEIVPPIQLFLNITPSVLRVSTGGSLAFTLTATDGNGTPAGGILLLSSVLAGIATITPFCTTDYAGRGDLVFAAPPGPGPVNVSILVVQPGYWGHLTVSVAVVVPPPSLWQRAAPFAAVAGVGLVALAGALYVRWRHKRRPRLPIPPLALPPPPPGGPGNQSPAVSRTPP